MSTAVAERYARAIFELGVEANQLAEVTEQVGQFAAAYATSSELRNALANPVVPEQQREGVVKALATRLGMSTLATNSIRLLVRRRRLGSLAELSRRLVSLADAHSGFVRAVVTTPSAFAEPFYEKLAAEIGAALSKRVRLERRVDASLIAGVVTTIGDNTIDGSLKGRLEEFAHRLSNAAR